MISFKALNSYKSFNYNALFNILKDKCEIDKKDLTGLTCLINLQIQNEITGLE